MKSSGTLSKILRFPKAFLDWLIQRIVGTVVVLGVFFLVWKFFKEHILELPPLMKWPRQIGFTCSYMSLHALTAYPEMAKSS